MRLKKTIKNGECGALRCVRPAAAEGLCEKHHEEWEHNGRPDLTGAPVKATPEKAASLALDPQVQSDLELERQRTIDAIKKAQEFPVDTPANRDRLAALTNKAKERIQVLEKQRTSVTGPLNKAVATINSWFKPTRDALQAFADAGTKRIEGALEAERAERQKALAEIEAGAGEASPEAFAAAHKQIEAPAGTVERKVYHIEIVKAEDIPRGYLMINEPLMMAELRAGVEIPGVRLVESTTLVKAAR